MKFLTTTAATILLNAALGTQAQEPYPQQSRSQAQAAAADAQAQQAQTPTVSATPGEFLLRTAQVARQQAEAEVHYETRVRVQKLFNGVFNR